MGWQDRHYSRDRDSGTNPLLWILTGSVALGSWFGIVVRVHASLIVCVALALLFLAPGNAVAFGSILFFSVLLHEFGHCFASRWVGGQPVEIMMTPLGGLALADAPHRPWATFVTVLGGPAVTAVICAFCSASLWLFREAVPWNPLRISAGLQFFPWVQFLLWWTFIVNWGLLLFNLWPIFPLDGGQLLQSLLWVKIGYYKATLISCTIGMIGGGIMAMLAIATHNPLLIFIAASGFLFCMQLRRELKANGPWAYQEDDFGASIGYSASSFADEKPRRKWFAKRAIRRAQRRVTQEQTEQKKIDAILAKVSAQGMQSLTWLERRALHKATEHQRKRDEELSRTRHARA